MAIWLETFELGTLLAESAIAVALAPEFLKHRSERAERAARIGLNIEVLDPRKLSQPIFGMEKISSHITDLIDRASAPDAYASLDVGNEILIVGPEQSGKKALALHIAKLVGMSRAIIVYNPRDADVLARAKYMIEQTPPGQKTMLLLPGLDPAYGNKGEAWCDQLEALIETASALPYVLIIGTVRHYERTGEVASWFGTVLPLPEENSDDWKYLIRHIAEGYLDTAMQTKPLPYQLAGIDRDEFIRHILEVTPNPAEVRDIFAQCQTLATHRLRQKLSHSLQFTPEVLEIAVERVIPPTSTTENL